MRKLDVFRIEGDLYLVVQADHLLVLNTVILVPVTPAEMFPAISKLTVDVQIEGRACHVRTHMPLTVSAARLRSLTPVCQLSPDEGQKVMDGLNTILWGL